MTGHTLQSVATSSAARLTSVLVADDSETVRQVVRLELEAAGYQVIEAADGRQALTLAGEHLPDVVLLDVVMPEMDGYEALDALKGDPRTASIPVVFLTGRGASDDVVRALSSGAHDHLRKPPETAELLARVASAARVKALQDELRQRAEDLDRVSRTDVLTGLHNRRHMEEQLRGLSAAARRHGFPLTVLVLDVDHFKRVNDTAGHSAGDQVLRELSSCLRAQLRVEDFVGRWGGEEFLVVLPHTGPAAARVLAERLRRAVGAMRVDVGGDILQVTISVGGASYEPADHHDLLVLADQQLYAAKQAGRDQVSVLGA